jgi:hypothetical protein
LSIEAPVGCLILLFGRRFYEAAALTSRAPPICTSRC